MHLYELPEEILRVTGAIDSIVLPRQGHTSVVAVLETSSRKFVVKKTEREPYHQWLSAEYEALRHLSRSGLPVPQAYAFHASDQSSWLLMDHIDGVSVREYLSGKSNPNDRERAISSFGRCLRMIHECPWPNNWASPDRPWLDHMLQRAEEQLACFEVDGTPDLLARLKQNRPKPIEPRLIHGDFTIDNVLVKHDGTLAGIIDWAGAALGDPRYDLALAVRPKPMAFQDEAERGIFMRAYGNRTLTAAEYEYFAEGLYAFF